MPFEGDAHQGTWIAWPYRAALWNGRLEAVQAEYAGVAAAIAAFEPVVLLAPPGTLDTSHASMSEDVPFVEMPLDDSWIRDNGPTILIRPDGRAAAVSWRFNAWGAKHAPWDKDALAADRLAGSLGLPRWPAPITTEGGAIHSDGDGTLLVTETSILNPNRNPGLGKDDATRILAEATGAEKVIWLPGDPQEVETDGHVDLIAAFAAPGRVVHETVPSGDPRAEIVAANIAALRAARDARGRAFELVGLPEARAQSGDSPVQCRSYVNFYLVNNGVIVPAYGVPEDREAVSILTGVFPDRNVVSVPCREIAAGGGAVHCITQQIPVF
ncbi:MAG: agmatine deiminase family protein [Alphaproteobacteria bacterium]|nr:agmatine deiminase family protein [Alphaproteobacteria bacterium]